MSKNSTLFALAVVLTTAFLVTNTLQAQEEVEIPWTGENMMSALKKGDISKYSFSGVDKKGRSTEGTLAIHITEIHEQVFGFEMHKKTDKSSAMNRKSTDWDDIYMDTVFDPVATVVGAETVTTPAGTFETVVVNADVERSGTIRRQTYWMIIDQPGVYAKWVNYDKIDEPTEITYILQEHIPSRE